MASETSKTPTVVFRIVLACMDLASKSPDGTFYLSDAVYHEAGVYVDPPTLYGYTGNPGISGALQNLGVIEHAPVRGHFRMVAGYSFPDALVP